MNEVQESRESLWDWRKYRNPVNAFRTGKKYRNPVNAFRTGIKYRNPALLGHE
jgi:hypothetical protein